MVDVAEWKQQNVGLLERALRVGVGLALLLIFTRWLVPSPWNYLLLVAGAMAVFTGICGKCPLYSALGINRKKCKRC